MGPKAEFLGWVIATIIVGLFTLSILVIALELSDRCLP